MMMVSLHILWEKRGHSHRLVQAEYPPIIVARAVEMEVQEVHLIPLELGRAANSLMLIWPANNSTFASTKHGSTGILTIPRLQVFCSMSRTPEGCFS